MPHYADNIERVARQARLLKGLGHFSIALDTFHSGNEIYKACSYGREEECTRVKYTEGGRLTGSIIGGSLGMQAGYTACNLLFAIESAGTSPLWCGLVAGGAGAYAGGTSGGFIFENVGFQFYKVFEND